MSKDKRHQSIGVKLGALFGFLVVVLVGVGWLGLDRMARIDADLERKVDRRWEKLRLSSEALSYSILNNRVMMEIFLPKQGEEINPLLAQRADNSERITSLIATLESGIESERARALLDAVKETRTPYVESYKRALDLRAQEGKYEEGRATLVRETLPRLADYHHAWNAFVEFEGEQMGRAVEENNRSDDGARRLALYLLVLAVAVTAGIAVFVTRSMARDARRREQSEAALRESEERYRDLFENANDIIYTQDLDGNYTSVNRVCERLVGYTREEALRMSFREVIAPEYLELVERMLASKAGPGDPSAYELEVIAKGGQRLTLEVNSRLMCRDGRPVAVQGIARDVTRRKRAEEELKKREAQLAESQRIAQLGSWELDVATGRLNWSDEEFRRFGFEPGEIVPTFETYAGLVHPEDREYFLRRAERTLHEAGEFAVENRIVRKDGEVRVILARGKPALDERGHVVRINGTTQDITERKRIERELEEARDAALESARLKSEFLANMSHEIRTPMNGIIGMTELALDTDTTPEQREYLSMVKSSAESLLTLINDILDFSKIEAGRLDLDPVAFGLRDTLADTVRTLALRAHQKGLELAFHAAADVPDQLVGDAGRLRQVVVNLIGNAIKFTSAGEVVARVSLESLTGETALLHFSVSDTGVGIPSEKQAVIFDAFSQADGTTTRRYGGTGLGLSISSRLVEMMGGTIWVESRAGEGSTFHFTAGFGLRPNATDAPADSGVEADGGAATKCKPRLRILLAEDNEVNQRLAVRMLEKQGHAVTVACNGAEAVAELERQSFDLVLMDVQMPEMGGFEATAALRLKEVGTGLRLPVIAMTAHAMKGDRERCLEAGMDGYVSKPIQAQKLREEIGRLSPSLRIYRERLTACVS